MYSKKLSLITLACLSLAACSSQAIFDNRLVEEGKVTDRTRASDILTNLPGPTQKIAVSVYDFQDQTGQFKNNGTYTDYSSAVTKGGYAILVKSLLEAGQKPWFTVIERNNLKNLLQERNIIEITRNKYLGASGEKLPALPPLLYGGVLIEGGIVSYDSNVITGGAGAIYLGIGATTQYHRDLVTVYLRAVSVKSGEVLLSVNSSKTIFSTELDTNLLKYVTFDRLLQAEAGVTANEPTQLGVRQAVETGVYSLIMEGALHHLWAFENPAAGKKAIKEYLKRRDGGSSSDEAEEAPAPKPVAAATPAPSGNPKLRQ
jgi:curli production assembly/transport component CsgG